MSIGATKDRVDKLFENDAESITIRVSRWGGPKTTEAMAYQVLVKGRDATTPWGVGCLANPNAAFDRAFDSYFENKDRMPITTTKPSRRKSLLS